MTTVVGIPICLDDRGRWRSDRAYHYIDAGYVTAVERAGASLLYLPIQSDAGSVLTAIDGLLLPGGDDLAPPTPYPNSVSFDLAPDRQLEFDRQLLSLALAADLPVLAICYGMQLLALQHGGRLHYDLPTDLPDASAHRVSDAGARHQIAPLPGSRLAEAIGAEPRSVNSLHHQAVADPGSGLSISARAEDGVIEAIERSGSGFCLGVQWHPEKLDGDPASQALFAAFVSACSERSEDPT